MTVQKTPVLFVHGLWLAAESWQLWVELFAAAGYDPVAPAYPGEAATAVETRLHPEDQAGIGISETARHYAGIAGRTRPVVIGHSIGGVVAQKLVTHNVASAAIALSPGRSRACWRCRPPS